VKEGKPISSTRQEAEAVRGGMVDSSIQTRQKSRNRGRRGTRAAGPIPLRPTWRPRPGPRLNWARNERWERLGRQVDRLSLLTPCVKGNSYPEDLPIPKGSLSACVRKEGEDLSKLRKESSRNAPDHDDHFRTACNSPPRSPTSLAEIWRSHDGLSLRQRNPPSRPPWLQEGDSTREGHRGGGSCFLTPLHWKRQYHFLFFAFCTCSWRRKA
jgi:hypothetical protein